MDALAPVTGALLIIVGLNDVFHTLLHPGGRGRLTTLIARSVWRASKVLPPKWRSTAGPLTCIAAVGAWTSLLAFGWALVYLPVVPDGILYSTGVQEAQYPDWEEALYLSLVTLSTVGFGDLAVASPVVRLLSPIEALTGLALLTAAISWFLQLYPTLASRRAFALRLSLLQEGHFRESFGQAPETAAHNLHLLAADLARTRVELVQNSETYYFLVTDPRMSLPELLPYAMELSRAGQRASSPALATAAAALGAGLEDLADRLSELFRLAPGGSVDQVFEHYRADHTAGRTGR